MNVLVLNGSPKGKKSNTAKITQAFTAGFSDTENIDTLEIYSLNIRPCTGCFSCWSKTPGRCVINDDMRMVYKKILESDIIIESFPLYFFGMPSQVKAVTDRCLPFTLPYMGDSQNNKKAFHKFRNKIMYGKRLVVITSCGYVCADAVYPALTKQLDLICGRGRYTIIVCPEGELLAAEKAERQRNDYLRSVTLAGKEFCKYMKLSDETMHRLSKPILSPRSFETMTAAHWERM